MRRLEPQEARFDSVGVQAAPEPSEGSTANLEPVAAFIRSWEGCRLEAYQDGGGVWTIGVGHTEGVKEGDKLTQAEADSLFAEDLAAFASKVRERVKVEISPDQFTALCSLAFNIGIERFEGSTLLKRLNAGELDRAGAQILRWNRDNGRVVAGLVNRRAAEYALFMG